jgi:hypothetical protein
MDRIRPAAVRLDGSALNDVPHGVVGGDLPCNCNGRRQTARAVGCQRLRRQTRPQHETIRRGIARRDSKRKRRVAAGPRHASISTDEQARRDRARGREQVTPVSVRLVQEPAPASAVAREKGRYRAIIGLTQSCCLTSARSGEAYDLSGRPRHPAVDHERGTSHVSGRVGGKKRHAIRRTL